ncbi:MAG: imidazole glycerol phosphate synthase subunit HisH [Sporocytophaga sp.]|uniref:imidazole glycerol phosphate synthase subunit HisH n=1 Tax=Sporocytophaga sp. TaxID=2231183 RepID=UPI001B2695AB|nr:imidazole glycerol phosphate synthase subunit HisH [Sporocytophaga sp.]MBO9700754.1 imidazole glycerol phosphate synthase subunit HisH [Sporocytophaga sp.]
MKVAIIKYNAGNTQSVSYALNRLGVDPIITDEPELLKAADKVIFPGVGEASTAMTYLKQRNLDKLIPEFKQPFLGICLGLQLMCQHSEENDVECLKVFPMSVKRFPPKDKVPHMGWNSISNLKDPLFKGVNEGEFVYFVHSYYAELSEYTIAQSEYILPFSASINKDNFYAVQFHTEKSGNTGEKILKNFLSL